MSITTGYQYLRQVPTEQRKADADRIKFKYPDRVPIILLQQQSHRVPPLDKFKFLVPSDLTVGQFLHVVRKRMHISPEMSVYLFADKNRLLHPAMTLDLVYSQHQSHMDGFLYLTLAEENTFG